MAEWERHDLPVPLTVLESPYREVTRPIIGYIKSAARGPAARRRERVHPRVRRRALVGAAAAQPVGAAAKGRLLFQPGVMVTSVPWQLDSTRACRNGRRVRTARRPPAHGTAPAPRCGRGRAPVDRGGLGGTPAGPDCWSDGCDLEVGAPAPRRLLRRPRTRAGSCSSGMRCPASGSGRVVTEDAGGVVLPRRRRRGARRRHPTGSRRRARTPARAGAAAATGSTPTGAAQRATQGRRRARAVRAGWPGWTCPTCSARSRSCPAACSAGAPGSPTPSGRTATVGLHRHRSHELEPVDALPARRARRRRRDRAARSLAGRDGGRGGAAATTVRSRVLEHRPGPGRQARGRRPPDRVEVVDGPDRRAARGRRAHASRSRPTGFWQVHPGALPTFAAALLDGARAAARARRCSTCTAGAGALTAALADAVGPTGRVRRHRVRRARRSPTPTANLADLPWAEVRRGPGRRRARSPASSCAPTSSCSTRPGPGPGAAVDGGAARRWRRARSATSPAIRPRWPATCARPLDRGLAAARAAGLRRVPDDPPRRVPGRCSAATPDRRHRLTQRRRGSAAARQPVRLRL